MTTSSDVMYEDFCKILEALNLGTHARSKSYHDIVITEILPRIEGLKVSVETLKMRVDRLS